MSIGLPVNVDAVLGYIEILSSLAQVDVVFGYLEYVGSPAITSELITLEDWEAVTRPNITGWTSTPVSGASHTWTTVNSAPHVGNCVMFNCGTGLAGTARLSCNTAINMTTLPFAPGLTPGLSFWMRQETGGSSKADTIQPQVSTDGGTNWINLGSAIPRYAAASDKYNLFNVSLAAYAAETALRIGFLGTAVGSNGGYDARMDEIRLLGLPSKPSIDCALGYLEYAGGAAQIDTLFGYVEIGNGNTPAIAFGPRWQ